MKKLTAVIAILLCISLASCSADTNKPENESIAETTLAAVEESTVLTDEAETQAVTEAPSTAAPTTQVTTAPVPTGCRHKWNPATCLAPMICVICYETSGGLGAHTYNEATCDKPKTCKYCGVTSGDSLDCVAGADGNCINCGKATMSISSVLSAPMDSMRSITSFVSSYYNDGYYTLGNFRLIFNSVEGMILAWGATNISDKDIKYITFTIDYYNSVGDPAYDDISGKTSYTARLTGPIPAGKSFYFRRLIGYSSEALYGVITDVTVEFMDGTTVSGYYGYTTWHNIRTAGSPKECFIIEN